MIKKYACICLSLFIFSALFCACSKDAAASSLAAKPVFAEDKGAIGVPLRKGFSPLTGLPIEGEPKRPLAVMIDNVRVALPQRGLAAADIVYEVVTESGITRLMAIFPDYEAMPEVGPVRSARDQHLQLILPLNTMLLHAGSSTYATDLLQKYRYDSTSAVNGCVQSGALRLDNARVTGTAIEHCWFSDAAMFTATAKACGLQLEDKMLFAAFDFANTPRALAGGEAKDVQVRFSSYASSSFTYEDKSGRYLKSQFSAPQIDENTGEQLGFDNLLILFTDITKYPDGILAKVDYNFGGVGYYFNQGRYEEVRWLKGHEKSPLRIVSADKTETSVTINPGTTYVAFVDLSKYEYFKIGKSTDATASLPPVSGEDAIEAPD